MPEKDIDAVRQSFANQIEKEGNENLADLVRTSTASELTNQDKIGAWQKAFPEAKTYLETLKEEMESIQEERKTEESWATIKQLYQSEDVPKNEARHKTSEFLLQKFDLKTIIQTEQLWIFKNPHYERMGQQRLKTELKKELGNEVSRHDLKEIIETIKTQTYTERPSFIENSHIIPVRNGHYNIETGELEAADPSRFQTSQLPVKYDEEAECPKIKEFISEIVPEDQIPVIQEMIGYCLYTDYPIAKAFMLLGKGKNGKSTFLELLNTFLGRENVATPSLHQLVENRFAKSELYGKLANIHGDLSSSKIYNTGPFKTLTGQDTIRAERKHQQGFNFRNHAKLIFSANELPGTNDTTDAFFRRWVILEFPYKFVEDPDTDNPKQKEKNANLPDEILTDEELSGLLNWAIEGLERILENGEFTTSSGMKEIKEEWLTRTNPLQVFVDKNIEVNHSSYLTKDEFYKKYVEFCENYSAPSKEKNVIGRKLPQMLPEAEAGQKRIEGSRERVWRNLNWKTEEMSQPSQDSSDLSRTRAKDSTNNQESTHDTLDTLTSDLDVAEIQNNIDYVKRLVEQFEKTLEEEMVEYQEVVESSQLKDELTEELLDALMDQGVLYEPKSGMVKCL